MTSTSQNTADGAPSLAGTDLKIEAEILQISATLSSGLNPPDEQGLGAEDMAELLDRLNSADSMAQGVESKLDNILENLDKLLASLGTVDGIERRKDEESKGDDQGVKE